MKNPFRLGWQSISKSARAIEGKNSALRLALMAPVEWLESRVLLSISASQFAVFQPGDKLSYEYGGPGFQGSDTYTETVVGPATFNGQSANETDLVSTVESTAMPPVTTVVTQQVYSALTSNGVVNYGATSSNGSTNVVTTFSPYSVGFPASISAGQTVTSNDTITVVVTKADGTTKTTTGQETIQYTLPSESLQPITVPAGTFSCYQLIVTTTTNNGANTNTSTQTDYIDPGIGGVKEVSGAGSTEVDQTLTFVNINRLAFIQPPTSAAAGATIKPPVTVAVEDASGNILSTGAESNASITLALASGNGTVTGTLTETAVNGVATFSDLSIDKAGSCTLSAAGASLISATSSPFTITAGSLSLVAGNIALFNAPGSAEPDTQTIPLTITNTGTQAATYDLSVANAGSGNVSLSASSVSLAAGASTPITITPTADSSSPNDVHIIISSAGTQVAENDMTVVSVSFPQNIFASDTPAQMLMPGPRQGILGPSTFVNGVYGGGYYRIPPRIPTPENVMVTPNLAGSGESVTLTVTGQNSAAGTVMLDGNTTESITSTGNINLIGGTQTARGNAAGLYLTLQVAGENTIFSNGFSVAAIPENVTIAQPMNATPETNTSVGVTYQNGVDTNAYGLVVHYGMASDSGDLADIEANNAVFVSEQVQLPAAKATGIFVGTGSNNSHYLSVAVMLDPGTYDYHSRPFSITNPAPHTGFQETDQTFTFNDRRTGAMNIPVPQSGFELTRTAQLTNPTTVTFVTIKFGATTTANGYPSNAGSGSALAYQTHTLPTVTTSSVSTINDGSPPQLLDASNIAVGAMKSSAANATDALAMTTNTTQLSAASPAPGVTAQLVVTAQPPAAIASGTAFGLVVQAEDSSGTLTPSFTGMVTLTLNIYSGNPTAALVGTTTVAAVNGIATFSDLTLPQAGNFSLTIAASGLPDQTSAAFRVTPLAATGLVVIGPLGNVLTSSPFLIDVAATDPAGNLDTTFNGPVTLSLSSNPGNATLGGTITATAVNGLATFSGVTVGTPGSGYVLQASGDNFTAVSSAFDVNNDQLVVTSQPPASTAPGVGFGLTVSAENAAGMVDSSYNGAITIALDSNLTGPGITLAGTLAVQAVNGVATFTGLTMTDVGQYDLVATGGGAGPATSQLFEINAVATQLVVTTQPPSAVTAGAGFEIDVAAEDASGNIDTSFSGNVTVALAANPGGSTLGGTVTVAAVNGVATLTGLTLSAPDDGYTLTAAASGLTSATTQAINVFPVDTATQLVVTTQPPTTVQAGVAVGLVVKAEDSFGTVDATFTGPVTVSDPDGTAAGTLSVNAVAGVATFTTVMLDQSGPQVLAITSTGLTPASSNGITVNPGPATQLAISGPLQNVLPGIPFSLDVVAVDSFGNTDPTFTGAISLALGANPSASTLGGIVTVNAVAGEASFTNLTINNAGTGYTFTATGAGLTPGASQPFDVTVDQLVVTARVGQTIPQLGSFSIAVSAENGAGVVASSFTGPVTVSLLDEGGGPATLGGTLTVNAAAGVATFSGLTIDQTGAFALLFTAAAVGQTQSDGFTVTPSVSTTTTLSTSLSTVAFDNPVTLTATVASGSSASPPAGAIVTFFSGTTVIGSAPLGNNGVAVLTTAALPPGADPLTASFAGNGNFLPSVSSASTVTVGAESPVAPSLTRFVFPAVAVAGQPVKTNLSVVITNGGAPITGNFSVVLFVDMSASLDGNQMQVGKLSGKLALNTGKSKTFKFALKSLPASLGAGTYRFFAEVIDPTGATNVAASGPLAVQVPTVTLSAVAGAVKPGTIKLNHTGVATVTITDTGNVDAVGMIDILLSPSTDGSTAVAGMTLATSMKKVHLRDHKATTFKISFKVTSALTAGNYDPFFSVTLGGASTTAVGPSFTVD